MLTLKYADQRSGIPVQVTKERLNIQHIFFKILSNSMCSPYLKYIHSVNVKYAAYVYAIYEMKMYVI